MKHQFALYVPFLTHEPGSLKPGSLFVVDDPELANRVSGILRLAPGDDLLFFDQTGHAELVLQEVSKKRVTGVVKTYARNVPLQPKVTLLLPVLKREAFDDALYAAVELGASAVQPLFTAKTQRGWGSAKDKERATRVMIAAAEQSKNFSLPPLLDPLEGVAALAALGNGTKLFFDEDGIPLFEVLGQLRVQKPGNLFLLVGPEGDLTEEEKKVLKNNGFIFCALTPTVLRAVQAATVGLGAVRSTFNDLIF